MIGIFILNGVFNIWFMDQLRLQFCRLELEFVMFFIEELIVEEIFKFVLFILFDILKLENVFD